MLEKLSHLHDSDDSSLHTQMQNVMPLTKRCIRNRWHFSEMIKVLGIGG